MELIGIIFKEYEQDGRRVFSAEITCGTRDAVMIDWKSASFAVMEGCDLAGISRVLRETADRIDAMPNASVRDGAAAPYPARSVGQEVAP